MHGAFIVRIKNIRKHSNADRLLVGECFGNAVIVSDETKEGDLGIYFPTDMAVGVQYATVNKLIRTKDENGNNTGGFLEEGKLNIRALKLRGEISDGLFMPIASLNAFCDTSKLTEGEIITVLNGTLICEKYVPRQKVAASTEKSGKNKTKQAGEEKDAVSFPNFSEHIDTAQLAYNKGQFKEGDLCTITLKMHGTSGRTANSIQVTKKARGFFGKLFRMKRQEIKEWKAVSGSRRVVLKNFSDAGYYGTNDFRKKWHDYFADRLQKGECVYYEIVGYTSVNGLIMPECDNKKTNDKDFISQFGKKTQFTYGCANGENDVYVYRMGMVNEDGVMVEYPWSLIKIRCEQMGVKYVPELDRFFYTTEEDLNERVVKHEDGVDPVGKTHVREGVVVRIEDRQTFKAFKHKGIFFKILEGLIKTEAIMPDMEEAEGEL